jgi:translation initiation factor IF-2
MGNSKGIRLMKAAKEFNIGKDTLVQFLLDKKFEVENRPNTVLSEKMYEELMLEFSQDKAAKKKSEKISLQVQQVEKPEKKEPVKEKVSLKKEEAVKVKVTDKIDLDKPAPAAEPEPTPEPPKKKTVTKKKSVATKSKTVAKKVSLKKDEAVKLKVKDKIDLDKPAAKSESEVLAKKEEPKKEEKETKEEPEVKIENIKARKLEGPKILKKIELKEEVPRTRKKRKRIPTKGAKPTTNRPNKPWQQKGKPEQGQTVDPKLIQQRLKQTMNRVQGNSSKRPPKSLRKNRKKDKADRKEFQEQMASNDLGEKVLRITEFLSVSELASLMDADVTEVISSCMSLGRMVSINQRLDAELIEIVAEEFDYEVEFIELEDKTEEEVIEEDSEEDLVSRPPIVTIMGHVDHGKTSLLDYIRNASVVDGEAGGITQHIGAYKVKTESGKEITFLDTPGHEAFTAMRARGAKVTDVVVVVVAADDAVMPQTKEAISHAQAAEVPMIFAINKIDKDGANPDRIKEELSGMNILVEDWGGKYQSQEISAKKGLNISELLEKIVLEADLLELKANPDRLGYGTVVEASLDKGRGYMSTILVQNGTVQVGDMLLAGPYYGRIKAMTDERGKPVKVAGPSTPVQILGFGGAPQSGDTFRAYEDENEAKAKANEREKILREQGMRTKKHITLDEIGRRLALGNFQQLNLIIKGDVDGSVEALSDSLEKLSTEEIVVNVIHKAVGQITERDVLLASASDAIICGFQVRPSSQANKLAAEENIEIRAYSVIYDAIDEIKSAMEGMLEPKVERKVTAQLEVLEVFNITGVGKVAGCTVTDGKIKRDHKINLVREGIVLYSGELGALKRYKDEVKEVVNGQECGISVKGFNDIKSGDIVEAFEEIETKRTL